MRGEEEDGRDEEMTAMAEASVPDLVEAALLLSSYVVGREEGMCVRVCVSERESVCACVCV